MPSRFVFAPQDSGLKPAGYMAPRPTIPNMQLLGNGRENVGIMLLLSGSFLYCVLARKSTKQPRPQTNAERVVAGDSNVADSQTPSPKHLSTRTRVHTS